MRWIALASAAALLAATPLAQADDLEEIDEPASELEEVLSEEVELDEGAQLVRVVRVEMDPNTAAAWHTHPSPVYVYVIEGEVTLEVGDEERTIEAGEAVSEPLDVRMRALNTTDEPARAVVFQISPAEEEFLEEES